MAAPAPIISKNAASAALFFPTNTKGGYLRDPASYDADRAALVTQHLGNRFCSDEAAQLTADEKQIDAWLGAKLRADYNAKRTLTDFLPGHLFCAVKTNIEASPIYRLVQRMPKGALLHVHLGGAGRMDWIMSNALTWPNCCVKWDGANNGDRGTLRFIAPSNVASSGFTPVAKLFREQGMSFSNALRQELTLGPEDYNGQRTWSIFGGLFAKLSGFVQYRPIFTNYLRDAFTTLANDGVYHVELRDSLGGLYDEVNGQSTPVEMIERIRDVRAAMQATSPEFNCRLIVADVRWQDADQLLNLLTTVVVWRKQFPDLISGFDLIGGEDDSPDAGTLRRVKDLLPKLQALQQNLNLFGASVDPKLVILATTTLPGNEPILASERELPYFLHEGESLWPDNDNIFDAILLEAPRIGHGFNLFRYPTLYPIVKRRNVALEVCPISNQMLGLVPDLRTHPANGYLNAGIQCVLASDDPAIFGNDGLSYDFWEAITAWNLDLAAIKRLAQNSIVHSSVASADREKLKKYFDGQWQSFVTNALGFISQN